MDTFKQINYKITINHSIKIDKYSPPTGEILEGVGIDGFPIHAIECDYCVLEGKK